MSETLIDEAGIRELLEQLVSINSVNPSLVPGAPGEREISEYLAEFMHQIGLETRLVEVEPGRFNAVGVLKGSSDGRRLLLNGHTDTVGIDRMDISPLDPVVREGKLFGRGSCDMKGGLAAILGATEAVIDSGKELEGDVIVAAVCDEEYASIGTENLMEDVKPDAAIVGESTALQVLVAHKGFAWIDIDTHGVAAHGSLPDVGVDAIAKMGKVLVAVEDLGKSLRRKRHALVGTPSVHASLIHGGIELSTYPDLCKLQLERRMIPGETRSDIETEVGSLLDLIGQEDSGFKADHRIFFLRNSMEVSPKEEICLVLQRCVQEVVGREVLFIGGGGWLDTEIISSRGTPAVAFGPAGSGAHASVEYVELDTVFKAARTLEKTILRFCGANE